MSAIYSATVATMPNAVFLACAVVSGTGCTLSFLLGFKKNIAQEQA
jgi:hypothetical protein